MAVTIGSVTEGNANAEEIKNNSPDSELYEKNKKYLQGSLVKFNDKIYLAKRNVPSDVDLDNPYYWEIFMDAADSKRVDELFEKTGNLDELETESKDNLVNAINEAVLYTAQSLTEEQKVQARANIGAGTPYTLLQATAEAIGGVKADSAEAADTQPVRIGGDGKLYTTPGGTDISLGLTSAAVGQTIKVKAVDESGKPTAWEAANMPSGSGSNGGIHLIARVVTEANAASIEVTGLSTTAEVLSLRIYNPGSTCGEGLCITVNGIRKLGYGGTISGTNTIQAFVRAWLYRDGGTLYGRSQMANEGANVYEWPEMGEITSITVDSPYNDGTTKYFQAGTIFEIYEGMYPNVQ